MIARQYCCPLFLVVLSLLFSFRPLCSAQSTSAKKPERITKVTVLDKNGRKIMQLEIDLQNAPDNMEPVAEPRRIRIDDRASVQFLLKNLSPLDVCSRSASTPTPTAETPVAESMVSKIAGLGGLAIGGSTASLTVNSTKSMLNQRELKNLFAKPALTHCKVQDDPEYQKLRALSEVLFSKACGLIGGAAPDENCKNDPKNQLALAGAIDSAARKLTNYAGDDYRGRLQTNFKVDGNSDLQPVRDAYTLPLSSIENAGKLQAMVDEMTTWDLDLHKKYDYTVSAADTSSPTPPPAIPGALMVSPTTLSFNSAALTQSVQLSSGGQTGTFTATPSSDTGWLLLSKAGPVAPSAGTLKDTAPGLGTFALLVTVNSVNLDATTTHYGSITITGTGAAKGTTVVNVTFKPTSQPSDCDLDYLGKADEIVDRAKAEMSLLSDNNKTLESAQATLKASYMALWKVEDDFKRRKDQKVVSEADGVLVQEFNLGTDRKTTSPGYISCVSDVDGKTPTTTNINYSLLYQDVPHWSASVGLLTSFQEKKIIGIANESTPGTSSPMNMQVFAVTDEARVQLIPMAFVNYRIGPYRSSQYGKGKEDELVWTTHLSGGFGVNPNTGTNQPEFFLGLALGLNRFMIHPGVHFGRTESLGGGYSLGTQVPSGSPAVTSAPISWSYHPAFSIGFSVRLAPY